jgi:hypothetical protein
MLSRNPERVRTAMTPLEFIPTLGMGGTLSGRRHSDGHAWHGGMAPMLALSFRSLRRGITRHCEQHPTMRTAYIEHIEHTEHRSIAHHVIVL